MWVARSPDEGEPAVEDAMLNQARLLVSHALMWYGKGESWGKKVDAAMLVGAF